MKKVIVVGTWHRDQNQIHVINEILPLLESNHWVIGCEFDSKETVDDQIVFAKESMEKTEKELSNLLIATNAKFDLETLQNVTEVELKKRDSVYYDKMNSLEQQNVRRITIMYLTHCKSKAISIKIYQTLKESICSIIGIDSKKYMELDSHLRNQIFVAYKKRDFEEVERLESLQNICMKERTHKIVDNIIATSDNFNCNIIVFIGAGHLIEIKELLEKSKAVESSFYYLVPEEPMTALGRSDIQDKVDNTELDKFGQYNIVGITPENIGLLLNDKISTAKQNIGVKM